MNTEKSTKSITSWAEADRPREKMVLKGKAALSDAELVAILMASGNREQSAVELARDILASVDNDLNGLARKSINDLKKFKGVGDAKAISIAAALELGRRRKTNDKKGKTYIRSAYDAFEVLQPKLQDLPHEEFWVLLLDKSNALMQVSKVSSGGVSQVLVDPKLVFKPALDLLASGIILAHNHPSGNKQPSRHDTELTQKIKKGGSLLDIHILDHIIITEDSYYSFSDQGIL